MDPFSGKFDEVTAVADQEPVALMDHGEPRYVLMSHDQFKALTARIGDGRRAIRTSETPDDVAEWLLPALDALEPAEDADHG